MKLKYTKHKITYQDVIDSINSGGEPNSIIYQNKYKDSYNLKMESILDTDKPNLFGIEIITHKLTKNNLHTTITQR